MKQIPKDTIITGFRFTYKSCLQLVFQCSLSCLTRFQPCMNPTKNPGISSDSEKCSTQCHFSAAVHLRITVQCRVFRKGSTEAQSRRKLVPGYWKVLSLIARLSIDFSIGKCCSCPLFISYFI